MVVAVSVRFVMLLLIASVTLLKYGAIVEEMYEVKETGTGVVDRL